MISKLTKNIITALIGLSIGYTAQASEIYIDRTIALVNDDIILQSDLDKRLAQVKKINKKLPNEDQLRSQILERLILENIQLQLAKQQGINLSKQHLENALNRIAQQDKLSLKQYRAKIEKEGRSWSTFKKLIKNEIILNELQRRAVISRINITEQDIKNYLNANTSQTTNNIEVKLRNILIEGSDSQAQDIYQQLQAGADFTQLAKKFSAADNAKQGGTLGWRKLSELAPTIIQVIKDLNTGDISEPVRISNGFIILKLEQKRGKNKVLAKETKVRHILLSPNSIRNDAATKKAISKLAQQIKQGADFAKLAKEHSDDPGSGSAGGSLGWIEKGKMVPAFEKVMNSSKIGKLSKPFKSPFGWHILQVQDRREKDISQELLRNKAREAIGKKRFNEERKSWLREIRTKAYIDIK